MERYEYPAEEKAILERSLVPFAVYQFVDQRVVTLVLSVGFCKLFGYEDKSKAYFDMDNDMYRTTHPDDVGRIADAAYTFATEGGKYETLYRTKNNTGDSYQIIHAIGEHFVTDTGVQLAQVWYTDEGVYVPGEDSEDDRFRQMLNRALHAQSMIRASYYDYLTGLPSMTYFFQLAEAGCRSINEKGGKPAFLFLDLSGMKFFNHKHGFSQGDTLLCSFSKLLAKYFSNENCSRFGQDHFAVYTDAEQIEETIHELFVEWQSTSGNRSLPVRVGVYLTPSADVDVSIACDCAKLACDTLRNSYRSSISYYDKALQMDAEKQHYIVSHLDEALENGWIKAYYQPIVRAVNGRVCDEEALARWDDPVRGLLSPADFIPILEEAKIIYKLDLYVVDRIIEKIKAVRKKGLHVVPQSVNLSRTDFDACDIVGEICRKMDEAKLGRDLLTIEITESIVGSNFEFMKKQVDRFRKLGFQVWMDDFGSGYSSLDVLQSLEFDLIKFDMRFVQELEMEGSAKIVLSELMRMATALGIETVCEGVEKEEHVQFLREIGCAKLQGYYYCKPIPLEKVFERYDKGVQIGFEDPKESAYFESIGRINLYDLAVISGEGDPGLQHYFNNLPMAIFEFRDGKVSVTRSNASYRTLAEKSLGIKASDTKPDFSFVSEEIKNAFVDCMSQKTESARSIFLDEYLPDGSKAHTFLKKIAENPVDGTAAIVLVVLAISREAKSIDFADVAKSLATDYIGLFYVNLKTDEFVEYSSGLGQDNLLAQRNGADFFGLAINEASAFIYKADRNHFTSIFTKENVLKIMDEQGAFNTTLRVVKDHKPMYVHLKATRMENDRYHMIVGVSNIDAQMKEKVNGERVQRAQSLFSIVTALVGEFICVYTVDPETGHYTESRSSSEFEGLGFSKEGEDFFTTTLDYANEYIYEDDREMFCKAFGRENVMRKIAESGEYKLQYRMIFKNKPVDVKMRAVPISDKEGDRLIVGVTKAKKS
ncbi:MAG: EAL domain-containing protein [Lachnospiraceae bacterium]|nr:EAL domain-containing protein [Lachnospiraceae bacterium]